MSFNPRCTACTHPHREQIDTAIIGGVAVRDIAKTYSLVKSSVHRHRAHVSTSIIKAAARREERFEDTILGETRSLHQRTLALLTDAERTDDGRLRAVAISQVRENLELLAKLTAPQPESEADVRRYHEWVAEDVGVSVEELLAHAEELTRVRRAILSGLNPPHTPKPAELGYIAGAPYVPPSFVATPVAPASDSTSMEPLDGESDADYLARLDRLPMVAFEEPP